MKLHFKAIAAAALLATSGLASADIKTAPNTDPDGSGELFFTAYDTTSGQTYSFDTGVLLSSFGIGAGSQSFSLDGFSSFLATSTASTTRWGVLALDRLNPNRLVTTALGNVTVNPAAAKMNAALGNFNNYAGTHNFAGTHATQANGWAIVQGTGQNVDFGYGGYVYGPGNNQNGNLSFQMTGALTDTMNFFQFSNPTSLNSTRTQFGNASGFSTWSLNASTGNLSFAAATPPVPEPSTYALALAGFGVLGALARRRNKK